MVLAQIAGLRAAVLRVIEEERGGTSEELSVRAQADTRKKGG